MKKLLFIFLALSFVSMQASARGNDGNEMLTQCLSAIKIMGYNKSTVQEEDSAFQCTGYVTGIVDLNKAYKAMGFKTVFCMPVDLRIGQAIRVVVKSMQENPDMLHLDKINSVMLAYINAFPCTK